MRKPTRLLGCALAWMLIGGTAALAPAGEQYESCMHVCIEAQRRCTAHCSPESGSCRNQCTVQGYDCRKQCSHRQGGEFREDPPPKKNRDGEPVEPS